jgi:hypothetical protein
MRRPDPSDGLDDYSTEYLLRYAAFELDFNTCIILPNVCIVHSASCILLK